MENLKFNELKLSRELMKAIELIGFEEATPIQSQSIPPIIEGRDVIAQAPTGTGKTFAFGIPLIEMIDISNEAVQGLILCPTRELVIQTSEELFKLSRFKKDIKIVPIYGGQQIERQISALRRRPQIIIATPGRMMDHLRRNTVKINGLRAVILDEADEMLNMGFREDIDVILETVPTERQTILFSATLSKEIMDIANKYQKNAMLIKVTHKEITVPSVAQYYLEARGDKKIEVLTRLIDSQNLKLCLIFCNTKRKVDELTEEMIHRGYAAEALHGDMKQMQRDRVMARFKKGTVEILIATDVAARGIDVDNIEAVFNFDIPSDEEYYVHRIGRTGRANKNGVSYTFVSGKEMYKLRDIMKYTKANILPMKTPTISDVEEVKLKQLFDRVQAVIKEGKLTKTVNYIEKMIEEDETDELNTLDMAAALVQLMIGNTLEKLDEKTERTGSANSEHGMVRMFMNIGTLDKIRPRHITEIFTDNAGLDSSLIGVIDIFDKFSFVEIASGFEDKAVDALNGMNYKGRKLAIEKANQKKTTGDSRGFKPRSNTKVQFRRVKND